MLPKCFFFLKTRGEKSKISPPDLLSVLLKHQGDYRIIDEWSQAPGQDLMAEYQELLALSGHSNNGNNNHE